MKKLKLTNGHVAIVDDVDHAFADKHWYHAAESGGNVYARRSETGGRTRYLHREIAARLRGFAYDELPADLVVGFRNGDSLDCRRENLVLGPRGQAPRSGAVQYVGVRRVERMRSRPFRAEITVDGRKYHLGYHATAEEAAGAYDAAAIALHGERARLNLIIEGEPRG